MAQDEDHQSESQAKSENASMQSSILSAIKVHACSSNEAYTADVGCVLVDNPSQN